MSENNPLDDITQILNELAEAVKELNAVNYDILRIVDDDWSKLREGDSMFLMASMETAQKLLGNDKLNDLDGKEYIGNAVESSKLLLELKDYILRLKMLRTYYELRPSLGNSDQKFESYSERQAKIEANRKKLRAKRKKNKK